MVFHWKFITFSSSHIIRRSQPGGPVRLPKGLKRRNHVFSIGNSLLFDVHKRFDVDGQEALSGSQRASNARIIDFP